MGVAAMVGVRVGVEVFVPVALAAGVEGVGVRVDEGPAPGVPPPGTVGATEKEYVTQSLVIRTVSSPAPVSVETRVAPMAARREMTEACGWPYWLVRPALITATSGLTAWRNA